MPTKELREKYGGGKTAQVLNRAIRHEFGDAGRRALDSLSALYAKARQAGWERDGRETAEAAAYRAVLATVERMEDQVRERWGLPPRPSRQDRERSFGGRRAGRPDRPAAREPADRRPDAKAAAAPASAKARRATRPVEWTAALDSLLGTLPDAVLAARVGCSGETVRRRRVAKGVAAYRAEHVWTAESLALLGTMSDADLAARLGITPNAVKVRRHREGVKPCVGA